MGIFNRPDSEWVPPDDLDLQLPEPEDDDHDPAGEDLDQETIRTPDETDGSPRISEMTFDDDDRENPDPDLDSERPPARPAANRTLFPHARKPLLITAGIVGILLFTITAGTLIVGTGDPDTPGPTEKRLAAAASTKIEKRARQLMKKRLAKRRAVIRRIHVRRAKVRAEHDRIRVAERNRFMKTRQPEPAAAPPSAPVPEPAPVYTYTPPPAPTSIPTAPAGGQTQINRAAAEQSFGIGG